MHFLHTVLKGKEKLVSPVLWVHPLTLWRCSPWYIWLPLSSLLHSRHWKGDEMTNEWSEACTPDWFFGIMVFGSYFVFFFILSPDQSHHVNVSLSPVDVLCDITCGFTSASIHLPPGYNTSCFTFMFRKRLQLLNSHSVPEHTAANKKLIQVLHNSSHNSWSYSLSVTHCEGSHFKQGR